MRAIAPASMLRASAGMLIWRMAAALEGRMPALAAPAACAGAEETGGGEDVVLGPALKKRRPGT